MIHDSRKPARSRTRALFVYGAGAAALAWPWLAFGYLFAADEYVHVYNACLLDALLVGPDVHGLRKWFALNPWPEPNLLEHAFLLATSQVVPLAWAERGLVVALAAGIGYAFLGPADPLAPGRPQTATTPAAHRWRAALALLALAFVYGAVLRYGFLNYLLGMVGWLVALAATSRRASGARWAVAAWALALYFCHPIAMLLFAGTVSLREMLRRGLLASTLQPRPGAWGALLAAVSRWFAVPMTLFAAYAVRQPELDVEVGGGSLRRLGAFATHFRDLALYDPSEIPAGAATVALATAASAVGFAWLWLRGGSRATLAAVTLAVIVVAVVAAPDVLAGGAYVHQRLVPFAFVWALWASAHAYGLVGEARSLTALRGLGGAARLGLRPGFAAAVLAGAYGAVAGFTFARTPAAGAIAAELDELRAFSAEIPAGSAVLPVSPPELVNGREEFSSPLYHYAGVIGCERGIVLLDNYEASVGYFPVLWRPGRDPFAAMTRGAEGHPAAIPPTGIRFFDENVDYVLARGSLTAALEPSTAAWMTRRLREVARSASGLYGLYAVGDLPRPRGSFVAGE